MLFMRRVSPRGRRARYPRLASELYWRDRRDGLKAVCRTIYPKAVPSRHVYEGLR